MSKTVTKCCNETITLDSNNDSDLIECSILEILDKNNIFKTTRSELKTTDDRTRGELASLQECKTRQETFQTNTVFEKTAKNLLKSELKITSSLDDSINSGNCIQLLTTPKGKKSNANGVLLGSNRLLSGVTKTPNLPYLSKTKLHSIEKWLDESDFETVTHLSELNGAPLRSQRKIIDTSIKENILLHSEDQISSESSSIDAEVKRILRVVYGDDWKRKNDVKKSKTDPKKNKKNIPVSATDFKVRTYSYVETKTQKKAQRNILRNENDRIDEEKADYSDNSLYLGVKKLDESGSSIDLAQIKAVTTRKTLKKGDLCSDLLGSKSKTKNAESVKERTQTPKFSKIKPTETKKENSEKKTPVKTFLASLSLSTPKSRCHPEAQDFKINFKTRKEELTKKLFKLYNAEVFGNDLPNDMNFSWNAKLRGTAGYCYNKKITKSTGQIIRMSRIELSTKIIDRADRLRDTLIHELCHAASWVIDGVLDGHGVTWVKWSRKAMERFPELPPIRRCHNYEIATKYTYRCTGCGYSINRHSKSINMERKRCGYCFGELELLVNKRKRGKMEAPEFDSTRSLPAPNSFALFVKENYQTVKKTTLNAKHADIMKILSQQYSLTKKNEKPS